MICHISTYLGVPKDMEDPVYDKQDGEGSNILLWGKWKIYFITVLFEWNQIRVYLYNDTFQDGRADFKTAATLLSSNVQKETSLSFQMGHYNFPVP